MAEDFTSDNARSFRDEIKSNDREYDPNFEVVEMEDSLPKGLQFHTTATTAYKTGRKPRTLRAAYDSETETMYVVFYGGVYYMYEGVPLDVWDDFKQSPSPGNFLWENGFDSRNGMRYAYQPVDMNLLSPARKAALAASTRQAEIRQEGLRGRKTVKTLYAKGTRYKNKPNRAGF